MGCSSKRTSKRTLPSSSDNITSLPLVPLLLKAVNELLQLVSKIQGKLFTLPVINLLAPAFYKICAESPTMQLSCSVSLPVGVPIPADVNGDNFPDVTGTLFPLTNLKDVGARFMARLMGEAERPSLYFVSPVCRFQSTMPS